MQTKTGIDLSVGYCTQILISLQNFHFHDDAQEMKFFFLVQGRGKEERGNSALGVSYC
jgi:hypothetical protein